MERLTKHLSFRGLERRIRSAANENLTRKLVDGLRRHTQMLEVIRVQAAEHLSEV